jgi:hypothetical protein
MLGHHTLARGEEESVAVTRGEKEDEEFPSTRALQPPKVWRFGYRSSAGGKCFHAHDFSMSTGGAQETLHVLKSSYL